MGFLRGRREAPAWAAPLGAREYAELLREIDAALIGTDGHRIDDGVLRVQGRDSAYGLTNLVQQFALVERSERPALVRDHFAGLFADEEAAPLEGEALLASLRPRLWDARSAHELPIELIERPVAEDLVAVLSVDTPTSVKNLRPEDAGATGLGLDELWERALAQLEDHLPIEHQAAGHGIEAYGGESFFLASRLLDLEALPGEPATRYGALVAVPHRHVLLAHPIRTLDGTLEALNTLVPAAHGLWQEGPGSIVPHVYWWRPDGAPLLLHAELSRDRLELYPPEAFAALLDDLA